MESYDGATISLLRRVIEGCKESEQRFFHAAEHVRNRGLKVVLKTYVEQRARFAAELAALLRAGENNPATVAEAGTSLGRGWADIQSTMIVRRQDRQQHVLLEAAEGETGLLTLYGTALEAAMPQTAKSTLEAQAAEVQRVQRRLRLMAEAGNNRLLVRLFNDPHEAKSAIEGLQAAGFEADELYTAAIEDVALYGNDRTQRARSVRETALSSVVAGVGVGLVLALILAVAHRVYFPEVGGVFTSTPLGVTLELLGAGAALGALFGLIFGLLIGRDAAEDDAYLYYESLQDGDQVVAVLTNTTNAAQAEQIIGLRHQFEVEPASA